MTLINDFLQPPLASPDKKASSATVSLHFLSQLFYLYLATPFLHMPDHFYSSLLRNSACKKRSCKAPYRYKKKFLIVCLQFYFPQIMLLYLILVGTLPNINPTLRVIQFCRHEQKMHTRTTVTAALDHGINETQMAQTVWAVTEKWKKTNE